MPASAANTHRHRQALADLRADRRLLPCAACGHDTPVDQLDAKPGPGHFTLDELNQAADEGRPFDRLECATCYGPHYLPLTQLSAVAA